MSIRAIYENGFLKLLDPVNLNNGQEVKLTIQGDELTSEEITARLRAAGLLSEHPYAPPDAKPLTPEERERIGQKLAGLRTSDELINEDRGEY
jgi:predicted DNA-binding antitoxin AbrB/MazE fold protein